MNNMGFLFAGFAVAWSAAFVYVWALSRRTSALQKRLEGIERELRER